jgi:hypothetical protein
MLRVSIGCHRAFAAAIFLDALQAPSPYFVAHVSRRPHHCSLVVAPPLRSGRWVLLHALKLTNGTAHTRTHLR